MDVAKITYESLCFLDCSLKFLRSTIRLLYEVNEVREFYALKLIKGLESPVPEYAVEIPLWFCFPVLMGQTQRCNGLLYPFYGMIHEFSENMDSTRILILFPHHLRACFGRYPPYFYKRLADNCRIRWYPFTLISDLGKVTTCRCYNLSINCIFNPLQ